MLVPMVVGGLVDALTQSPQTAANTALAAAAALLGLGLLRALAVGGYCEASARLGLGVIADIRSSVFDQLRSPQARALSTGDLITRALRDPDRLRGFVDRVFVRSTTTFARGLFPTVMLFVLHPMLALWALAPIPLQQVLLYFLQLRLRTASRAAARMHAEMAERVQAYVSASKTAADRTAAAPGPDAQQLAEAAVRVEQSELVTQRLVASIRGVVWLCTSAGIALLWYRGSIDVGSGQMTIGTLVSFAAYAGFVYRPFRQFTQVVKTYQTGVASLERIAELLEPIRTASSGEPTDGKTHRR